MVKKLLSIVAAVSMIASAAMNFTVVSAQTTISVTDCNVANGSENTNTAAIVLTFDGNVNNEDLKNAVNITDASGKSYGFTVTSKDNKAQLGINGVKKNTNYTLSIAPGSDVGDGKTEQAFTRTFATGNTLYTSAWSQIGTNADRISCISDWGGKWYDKEDDTNGKYLQFVGKNALKYSLEQEAAEGVFELEYDRYVPSKMTDNPETPTENPAYSISDDLFFDNGKKVTYYSIDWEQKITLDSWHSYKYVVDFDKKAISLYVDGVMQSVQTDSDLTAVMEGATKAEYLKLNFGGAIEVTNREMWIRNVNVKRRNDSGIWGAERALSEKDGVTAITVKNNNTGTREIYYVLKQPLSGMVKVSFEFNANDVLKTLNKENTGIRFYAGSDSEGSATTVYSPYKTPVVNKWNDDRAVLNMPNGATELSSNEWHSAEYIFNIDSNNRTLVYAAIDGTSTICNTVTKGSALGNIAFFIETENNETVGDNILKVRNINVIDNYTPGKISVVSNIDENETIVPNDVKLTFSSPITAAGASSFALYDEDGEAIDTSLYSFSLDDTQQILSLKMNDYDLNKTYVITKIEEVTGYLGGTAGETDDFVFTTPNMQKLTGTWEKSYRENGNESSISTENGITTFSVTNKGTAPEGQEQTQRESFAYVFDNPVTGNNVPLTIKYSFKANEALALSESTIRFYPYRNGQVGGTCICEDFPYSTPNFRWDNVRFNLPQGVATLAPNEWHTIEYAFNIDSTNGTTLTYAILDDTITFTNYNKAGTKQLQSMDVWFYGTSRTADNLELQIKDLDITRAAGDFDVTVTNTNLTDENNKIHLDFTTPVSLDSLKAGVKVISGETEIAGAVTEYALAADGYGADITIGGINTTGNYTLSFASLQDCYGRTPLTTRAGFSYTASRTEGIVKITDAAATADDSNVNVNVVLSNGKFSPVSGKLIAAAYRKTDNKLVGIGFVDATLESETSDIAKTITFAKPSEDYTVRVMLWNSLDEMVSLCNSFTAR